jgi:Galactose oxidase-like, Early set domain
MALLPTGKVLAFGGSGNDPDHLTNLYCAEIFEPDEIGKDNRKVCKDNRKVCEISNEGIQGDIFCSGHAFLPDGKLLVAGGTNRYDRTIFGIPLPPFSGLEHSYLFDPFSLKWSRVQNLNYGRWYPTCIMISDGRVVTMAGLTKHFPTYFLNNIEAYSNSGWRVLNGANRSLPLYPRLHLLPTGEIFFAGSYNTHYTFPFSVRAFPSSTLNVNTGKWTTIGNPKNVNREEGTTVLLPLEPPYYDARVLLIAGGTPTGNDAISDAEMIDFSEFQPAYKSIQKLRHARYYVYPVLLPDKTVLVIGGKTGKKGHLHDSSHMGHNHTHPGEIEHHPDAVLEPELFTPNDQKWKPMADMKVDRLYHSNALLLLDGRVMTAGSNPHRTINELRIEIFRPPYMFRGGRPVIDKCPGHLQYEENFEIESSDAEAIKEICLIRPSVTTHCVNTEQRYVGLEFKSLPKTLQTSIPSNSNLAPPGYYMLFIVTEDGVPSVAKFVLLSDAQE